MTISMKSLSHQLYFLTLTIFTAAALLSPIAICIWFVNSNAVNVPYFDDWGFLALVFQKFHSGHLPFAELINIHSNEHPYFFPAIIMLIVGSCSQFNIFAFLYSELVFRLFEFACLCMLAWPILKVKAAPWLWLCPIPWIVFSLRQWECLLWSFTIHLIIASFCIVATVLLLERSRNLDIRFLGACLSALAASFSHACGLLIWPLGDATNNSFCNHAPKRYGGA